MTEKHVLQKNKQQRDCLLSSGILTPEPHSGSFIKVIHVLTPTLSVGSQLYPELSSFGEEVNTLETRLQNLSTTTTTTKEQKHGTLEIPQTAARDTVLT